MSAFAAGSRLLKQLEQRGLKVSKCHITNGIFDKFKAANKDGKWYVSRDDLRSAIDEETVKQFEELGRLVDYLLPPMPAGASLDKLRVELDLAIDKQIVVAREEYRKVVFNIGSEARRKLRMANAAAEAAGDALPYPILVATLDRIKSAQDAVRGSSIACLARLRAGHQRASPAESLGS